MSDSDNEYPVMEKIDMHKIYDNFDEQIPEDFSHISKKWNKLKKRYKINRLIKFINDFYIEHSPNIKKQLLRLLILNVNELSVTYDVATLTIKEISSHKIIIKNQNVSLKVIPTQKGITSDFTMYSF